MVIGIDIDDTITETSKIANTYLQDKEHIYISDYHELEKDDYNQFLLKYHKDILGNASLFKDAKKVINSLHKLGHKIVFVTARGSSGTMNDVPLTSIYFNKHGIYFDKIVFGKLKKGLTAKKMGVDIFIDDKKTVLDEIKTKKIRKLRMCPKENESKYPVVRNWQEIEKYILSLGGE